MKNVINILALCLLMMTIACGKDDEKESTSDQTAPELIIESPVDNTDLLSGNQVFVKALCKDDVALSKLTVTLSKKASEQATTKSVKEPWTEDDLVIDLSGTEQSVDELFGEISSDALAGVYQLNFTLADEAGKTTSETITLNVNMNL
ncbi:DUF4625 domain-containing protein [Saccharicrinis aurantiacus]|uniref:DUF4625 domain-containing protein n=1 Tax=Saccharicrinis aurantiacus TaxID=1849719 RepID=UPI002490706C|nr:DUF4625 domain-containing protein [Saccharicrinis aurantiacus]